MATAVVVNWNNKGFGFARRDDGGKGEVYVTRDVLPRGRRALNPGERIEFDEGKSRTGRRSATNVKIIGGLSHGR